MSWRERREAGPLAGTAMDRLARLVGVRATAVDGQPRPDGSTARDGRLDGATDPWRDLALEDVGTGHAGRAWNPRSLRALGAIVLACAVVSAWWWWSGRPLPVIEPTPTTGVTVLDATLVATATAGPGATASPVASAPSARADVVVHVAGLVSRPGLVRLPAGSRVADAIEAAGGVTKPRAADSVNLARVLVDGEQVVVSLGPATGGAPGAGAAVPLVDLNLADQAALESLPGVGPVLAERVLAWRAANGSFRSVDELGEVTGIGQATLARLRPLVRV